MTKVSQPSRRASHRLTLCDEKVSHRDTDAPWAAAAAVSAKNCKEQVRILCSVFSWCSVFFSTGASFPPVSFAGASEEDRRYIISSI